MKYLLSLLCLLHLSPVFAIVGGMPIQDGSFKQSVALAYRPTPTTLYGEIYCSATMIGPKIAITAAHCLKSGAIAFKTPLEDFIKNTWIYFGEPVVADLPLAIPQHTVEKVIFFPVSNALFSDLAIVVLKGSIPAESIGEPLATVAIADHTMIGKNLIHVGFGISEVGGPKGLKAALELPIVHINLYNGMRVGQPHTEGPSACNGDSGGSAYFITEEGQLKLIGVEQSISNHPCGKSATYFIPFFDRIIEWILEQGYSLY